MDKQELLNKDLYTVISTITGVPHLLEGKFFVVYSGREKATKLAQKLNAKIRGFYSGNPIKVCLITDKDKFFQEMIYMGFPLFIFDGAGQIHNLSEIYGTDFALPEVNKQVYVTYMGYQRMTKSNHIGKVKQNNINRASVFLNQNNTIMNEFAKRIETLKKYYKI